ncbi:hypothetical protein [Pseudomonas syringae]|uniref:Uncharacterized protein n=2 Tax=Pseudomonas syringae TaxID=317 RepID=A0A3M3LQL5_PSESX|nr:hypothetical protein [Pseudomonas syringae]KWS32222.1 hypothetical protein AL059_15135 [Pseudomonas syringae pv. papulans]MDH4601783.1 hypothetical protein [Pseudomonas syringae pv. papulans]MDH4623750.1 hypothetical protein [Pseudomonas syringae pv. papulans]RMN37504.1 hypothetical protein ALQ60_01035 [Pseudomonas syringae pv. papulans]RMN78957.1 hypothetical protein ALQ56_03160 [Pseudomonas syringae pv. papulans]
MTDVTLETLEEVLPPIFAAPEEPVTLGVSFSEVATKTDGSFVITVAGNRCHVTQDYNPPLYQAVVDYLDAGGHATEYAEDIVVQADPALLAKLWVELRLKVSDNLVSQYRDARDLDGELPITPEQFTQLLTWRQSVREWPQLPGYPKETTQPVTPDWIEAVVLNGE